MITTRAVLIKVTTTTSFIINIRCRNKSMTLIMTSNERIHLDDFINENQNFNRGLLEVLYCMIKGGTTSLVFRH